MKRSLIPVFFLLYCPLLPAQKTDCDLKGNPASVLLKQLMNETYYQNFEALRTILENNWSENEADAEELLAALRDLESYKSFSQRPEELELCTEGTSVATGYYKNHLTDAVDKVSLEMTEQPAGPRVTKIRISRAFRVSDIPKNRMNEQERLQALDAYISMLSKHDAFSGTVLLAREGKIIYQETFGKRYSDVADTISLEDPFDPAVFSESFRKSNMQPMKEITAGDLFNLASLNKIFTAVSILQLMEKGKLSLEDPLSKVIPDEVKSREAGEIRIKHLLSHTSGIGYNLDKLSFEPGSKFRYNNMNFAYLGEIIERISGMRYEDYLRMHILGPSGMASTAIYMLKKFTSSLVIGEYEDIRNGKYVLEPNPYIQKYPGSSMGGMYSTAQDLLKFGEALRTGKLLKPETVELMRRPRVELNAPEYGYGVVLWQGPGIWGHSGRLPGADADLEIYGDTGFVAVVLSNKSEANPPVLARIRTLFYPQSVSAR